jgi:cytochrome P450
VNGQVWQRHRKATAACFNEKSNLLVWTEALRQGHQVLQHWKSAGIKGVQSMAHDTRTLTLDVLVHAQFGKSFDFQASREKRVASEVLSYRDALAMLLENAILILALGPDILRRLAFIPPLGRLSEAADQFKQYMVDMFEESSQKEDTTKAQGNLITSLVRASVDDKLLTPEEVISNIFVFNFAGHDTTAHSFAFTLMLLAAHPEVQDWMAEEIKYVVGNDAPEPSYDVFPKFVRTLAVLVSCSIPLRHALLMCCSSKLCDCTIRCSVLLKVPRSKLPA